MAVTVQLHTRVLQVTKVKINQIARAQRCQLGAVVDKAIAEYYESLKSGESITLPPSGVNVPLGVAKTPQRKHT